MTRNPDGENLETAGNRSSENTPPVNPASASEDVREKFRRLLAAEEMPGPESEPEPPPGLDDTAPLKLSHPPVSPPPFGGRQAPGASSPAPAPATPTDASVEADRPAPQITPPVTPPGAGVTKPPAQPSTPSAPVPQPGLRRPPPPPPRMVRPPAPPTSGPPLSSNRPSPVRPAVSPPARPPVPAVIVTPRQRPRRSTFGCLLRAAFLSLLGLLLVAVIGAAFLSYQYYRIARTLPVVADLRQRASQFETTRILDRNGQVLDEILDPNAGRRTYVPLSRISPLLVAATIATEDSGFYSHPGFDVFAIARAFWQNYQSGETVSGASTITQQLARILLFSPEERVEQSYDRKMREAILAAEITRLYSKDEILELYLNEIYFGNLAYGAEAAAETYFNTRVDQLTLAQAAFLAGLPQAPAIYDVFSNPEAVLARLEDVLVLMYQASQEQGCIYVSNSPARVCIKPQDVVDSLNQIRATTFTPPKFDVRYPHWVYYIRSLLEAQYDPQMIYRSGFTVYTTLDPTLQELAQKAVTEQVAGLAAQRATNGALVAIRPSTGEILALVGSADFSNEAISGQVNMALSPRQPGSSIKPLTYLAAFEKGWTPATLLWDVPSEFPPSGRPDDLRPPYIPVNYDGRFHGPVTLRSALANSYNIPAVKTLQFVGIYDDPATPAAEGLIALASRLGITTLTRPDYGLSLTLGGGDVSLLELTGAYSIIANGGRKILPQAISRILDNSGAVVYEAPLPSPETILRPEHAYLMASILSDNAARTPAFGANSALRLNFPAAVKTGTTNDFRDNWTLGFTPDLAVGVWVGNADYSPMVNTTGLSGAAPIWASVMTAYVRELQGGSVTPFTPPPGLVELVVCSISGTFPSKWCPEQRAEIFAADQPPLPKEEDLWQKVAVDTWTGLRASAACSEFVEEIYALNVTDEWARKWIRRTQAGAAWAERLGFPSPVLFSPSRECRSDDPRPRLAFASPGEGETIQFNPLNIYVLADATPGAALQAIRFDSVTLEFGLGSDPMQWQGLAQSRQPFNQPELFYSWDISQLPPGPVTLRLVMRSTEDTFAIRYLRLNLLPPTPTPTLTPTPTETPLPTSTLVPTETPVPPEPSPTPGPPTASP